MTISSLVARFNTYRKVINKFLKQNAVSAARKNATPKVPDYLTATCYMPIRNIMNSGVLPSQYFLMETY